MKIAFTRRNLLLGGGINAATAGPFDYFKAMLRSKLPGVDIPDASIHAFAQDTLVGRNSDFAPKLKVLAAAVKTIGFDAVNAAMHNNFDFQKFNREFLTDFLLGSDFFALSNPRTQPVSYSGMPRACSNPFAQTALPAALGSHARNHA